MSTPTRNLGKLPIRESMPTTRAQAQRERQRVKREATEPDVLPSIESPAAEPVTHTASPPKSPIRGHSGLLYDVQQLSPNAFERASAGLGKLEFVVDRPRVRGTGLNSSYGFQLFEPVGVSIFNPAGGRPRVECTCQDFHETSSICVHIYWLFDGLNSVLAHHSPSSPQYITKDRIVTQITDLYGQIGGNLDSLPGLLNGENSQSLPEQFSRIRDLETSIDVEDSGDEAIPYQIDDYPRNEIIRDMLAVFDPGSFPKDYRPDLVANAPTRDTAFRELFVPRDLAATIFKLASHDGAFYKRLRKLLTRDFCALQTFQHLGSKARALLDQLDAFFRLGPTAAKPLSVSECAKQLRIIVEQIRVYKNNSGNIGPAAMRKAAEVLVQILTNVCDWDRDLFSEITWPRTGPYRIDPEDDDDRNLYINLIGDPPEYDDSEPWVNNDFVIDVLSDIPPNEWKHLYERLTMIRDLIVRNGFANDSYLGELDKLLSQYPESYDDPTSGPSQRRRPTDLERESQRRRLA